MVVSGTEMITGWEPYRGNIFVAEVDFEPGDLFVDGQRMNPARHPNAPSNLLKDVDRTPHLKVTESSVEFDALPKDIELVGAVVWAMTGDYWVAQTGVVTSRSASVLSIGARTDPWSTGPGYGYVTGALGLLDAESEWHYEDGTVFLWLPEGADPGNLRIEAGKRRNAVDLNGNSHIVVRNLNLFGAAITMKDATYCEVDRCNIEYLAPFFFINKGWNRTIGNRDPSSANCPDGCAVEGLGVIMSGHNNVIRNSTIAYSYGEGVLMYGHDNLIENCRIHDCNWSGSNLPLISVIGPGQMIRRNSLYNVGRFGILCGMEEGSVIEYNDIFNTEWLTDDGGGIYSYWHDAQGSQIRFNWVHDDHGWAPHRQVGAGIYLDNNCANYSVHHNVVWNCTHAMRINAPWTNYEIYNNTLIKGMVDGFSHESRTEVKTWNNLSDSGPFLGLDMKNNLAVENPLFINSKAGDFRLRKDSPAIDFGREIPGITDGFHGSTPDAGAYEFGGTDWSAGAE